MPRIFNYDDCTMVQSEPGTLKDGGQPLNHEGRSGVLEPEQDYAGPFSRRGCCDLAKVEVESDDDPVFRLRFGEDAHVCHPLQALIAEMGSIMPILTEPDHDPAVHVHVSKKMQVNPYDVTTCSWVSHAAYSMACWMSSRSRSGYPSRISSKLAPCAICRTITDTEILMPRMQARPPMIFVSNVMRSNISS
jgi:hypothetical protein